MPLPLRLSYVLSPLVFAGLSSGCMGRVDPGQTDPPPGSSSGASSSGTSSGTSSSGGSSGASSSSGGSGSSGGSVSSSSSSGGPGDPDCSLLAVPDLARVCPDGSSVGGQYVLSNHQCVLEFPCPVKGPPPIQGCTQGGTCQPGSGCGSVTDNSGCSTSCMCDGSGHFQCNVTCQIDGCSQGSKCSPGTGCGSGGGPDGCSTSCMCDPNGYLSCGTVCVDAGPPPVTDPCPGFAVPDICEICSNGTTECAHAILVMGQCQVEICPGS
jgi:hypothetical protein